MKLYLTDPTSHQHDGIIKNLGDIIIKEAIIDNLNLSLQPQIEWVPIDGYSDRQKYSNKDAMILAGANILANNPLLNTSVWKPGLRNFAIGNYLILFGVGWWQYQASPDFITKFFYKYWLRKDHIIHSVRDSYTEEMLRKCGIGNVVNTGCPSMWKLPEQLKFESVKPESVVFTITDYYKNPKYDRELIQIILQEYNCVYFFPQGIGDIAYIKTILDEITLEKIEILERSLTAFDDLLKSTVIDYVGTRLHGGIRALQNSRRAFIIAVDNRALEISKDTQLPVTHRNNLSTLSENINKNFEFTLKINRINIEKFKTNLNKFLQG